MEILLQEILADLFSPIRLNKPKNQWIMII